MKMKKFFNKSEDITKEVFEGLSIANSDILELKGGNLVISKALDNASSWEKWTMNLLNYGMNHTIHNIIKWV